MNEYRREPTRPDLDRLRELNDRVQQQLARMAGLLSSMQNALTKPASTGGTEADRADHAARAPSATLHPATVDAAGSAPGDHHAAASN